MVSFSKFKRPTSGDGSSGATNSMRAPSSSQKPLVETYGRSAPPPPPGSSYWQFLHWASDGGMPFEEDADLAISMWMGQPPEPEGGSGPKFR